MLDISLLEGLLTTWAAVTGIVVVLLIYRSTLGSPGEDQLYLSEAEDMLEREHRETLKKEKKLAPFLYVLGTISVVLLVSIVGIWLWEGLLMT